MVQKIVEHVSAHVTEIDNGDIYLPDSKGIMTMSKSLLFNDAHWLCLDGRDDLHLVHELIPNESANRLGARSLRQVLTADSSVATASVSCPQAADVTALLAGVACGVEGATTPLFDFLECADICGSHSVQFFLDMRSHPSTSLLQPTLSQFQGPGLCMFLPEVTLNRMNCMTYVHGNQAFEDNCRYGSCVNLNSAILPSCFWRGLMLILSCSCSR